eukprot:scaffold9681_cov103-Skeletonema_dohrnii-CCMP3373.AAC.6
MSLANGRWLIPRPRHIQTRNSDLKKNADLLCGCGDASPAPEAEATTPSPSYSHSVVDVDSSPFDSKCSKVVTMYSPPLSNVDGCRIRMSMRAEGFPGSPTWWQQHIMLPISRRGNHCRIIEKSP